MPNISIPRQCPGTRHRLYYSFFGASALGLDPASHSSPATHAQHITTTNDYHTSAQASSQTACQPALLPSNKPNLNTKPPLTHHEEGIINSVVERAAAC